MDDTISRQAAINAIENTDCELSADAWNELTDAIASLPSAQPEPLTEIQEILNYLDTTLHPIVSPDNWNVYSELYDMVSKLPSAQPDVSDRKVGEWIIIKRHEHYPSGKPYEQLQCPFCKRFDKNGDGSFCGYCGARMAKGDSEWKK